MICGRVSSQSQPFNLKSGTAEIVFLKPEFSNAAQTDTNVVILHIQNILNILKHLGMLCTRITQSRVLGRVSIVRLTIISNLLADEQITIVLCSSTVARHNQLAQLKLVYMPRRKITNIAQYSPVSRLGHVSNHPHVKSL